MSVDRRARYRLTFEVEVRETGPEWDEEYLAYAVRQRIVSVGDVSIWDNDRMTRATVDFRTPRNFQLERFHVREMAK